LQEVDWWGVGVMAYEMVTGVRAFDPGDEESLDELFE
jgi:hypothetical protein